MRSGPNNTCVTPTMHSWRAYCWARWLVPEMALAGGRHPVGAGCPETHRTGQYMPLKPVRSELRVGGHQTRACVRDGRLRASSHWLSDRVAAERVQVPGEGRRAQRREAGDGSPAPWRRGRPCCWTLSSETVHPSSASTLTPGGAKAFAESSARSLACSPFDSAGLSRGDESARAAVTVWTARLRRLPWR